jgi:uncharacterized protein (DUF1330 family)
LALNLTVNDLGDFLAYVEAIRAFIAKHGGRYASKGADPFVMEGDWSPQRRPRDLFARRTARQRADSFW